MIHFVKYEVICAFFEYVYVDILKVQFSTFEKHNLEWRYSGGGGGDRNCLVLYKRERCLYIMQIINKITANLNISALYKMNSKITQMSKNCWKHCQVFSFCSLVHQHLCYHRDNLPERVHLQSLLFSLATIVVKSISNLRVLRFGIRQRELKHGSSFWTVYW